MPLRAAESRLLGQRGAQGTGGAGRTRVKRITATGHRFRQQLVGRGVPAEAPDQLLGIVAASRPGEFAAVDPTPAALLGRKPITLSTVLRDQLPDDDGH
ncbi:hypothetical protein [Streptomyces sp. NPDC050988]|uniref:hypothetical protein n=1 Tax=Streptomyces sp. NPDC050988 TaxID=3365637 RepID=UPI0037BB364A